MGAVGIGIGIVSSIIGSALARHTLRLRDATSENQAMDQVIPAFDADMEAINQAFNSGTSADECISALVQVDQNIFAYLYSLVGKPGTAWNAPTTAEIGQGINPQYAAPCNKSCTASCCVYLNDLRPAIFGRGIGVNKGAIEAIQKGGGSVQVPSIAAPPNSAYGNYSRAGYTLTFKKPTNLGQTALQISVSGVNVVPNPAPAAPSTSLIPSGILGTVTNSTLIAVIGLIGGILLIITALFGQNALRVNR